MSDIEKRFLRDLISDLKRERDQARVQLNLGGKELKDEWGRLNERLEEMSGRFERLVETTEDVAEDVWESLKLVGGELKDGFRRIVSP